MKLVIKDKNNFRINKIFEFILYFLFYTAAFLLLESFFDSFEVSPDHKILYSFLAVFIIYVLDQVVKPIIVTLTMPLTGLTFGLFYFVINTLILKITDWIMLSKLNFTDIYVLFFISILLFVINILIQNIIIKPLVKKVTKK